MTVLVKVEMVMKVLSFKYTPELQNKSSPVYKETERNFTKVVSSLFDRLQKRQTSNKLALTSCTEDTKSKLLQIIIVIIIIIMITITIIIITIMIIIIIIMIIIQPKRNLISINGMMVIMIIVMMMTIV